MKLLLVSEKVKRNFWSKAVEKLLFARLIYCNSGIEAEEIVNSEKPDLLLLDITKPVNGNDLVSMLRLIDGNIRLRVAIFNVIFPKIKFPHFKPLFLFPTFKKAAK